MTVMGSDDRLSCIRRLPIIGTDAGLLLINFKGKKMGEIWVKIKQFQFGNVVCKRCPFYIGIQVLARPQSRASSDKCYLIDLLVSGYHWAGEMYNRRAKYDNLMENKHQSRKTPVPMNMAQQIKCSKAVAHRQRVIIRQWAMGTEYEGSLAYNRHALNKLYIDDKNHDAKAKTPFGDDTYHIIPFGKPWGVLSRTMTLLMFQRNLCRGIMWKIQAFTFTRFDIISSYITSGCHFHGILYARGGMHSDDIAAISQANFATAGTTINHNVIWLHVSKERDVP